MRTVSKDWPFSATKLDLQSWKVLNKTSLNRAYLWTNASEYYKCPWLKHFQKGLDFFTLSVLWKCVFQVLLHFLLVRVIGGDVLVIWVWKSNKDLVWNDRFMRDFSNASSKQNFKYVHKTYVLYKTVLQVQIRLVQFTH